MVRCVLESNPDGTFELSTCLPSRGKSKSSKEVWVNTENDPLLANVEDINKAAFSGCKYLAKIDIRELVAYIGVTMFSSIDISFSTRCTVKKLIKKYVKFLWRVNMKK